MLVTASAQDWLWWAAEIARKAYSERSSLKEAGVKPGYLTAEEYNIIAKPDPIVYSNETR